MSARYPKPQPDCELAPGDQVLTLGTMRSAEVVRTERAGEATVEWTDDRERASFRVRWLLRRET